MRLGYLITCYKQVKLVEENIVRIRTEYKKLNTGPIVIVSTSEDDVGYGELCRKYPNVRFITFSNAPCDGTSWQSKSNPNLTSAERNPLSHAPVFSDDFIPGGIFRYKWLAMRILLSMRKGINAFVHNEIDVVLHLHSDSYWQAEKEYELYEYAKSLLWGNGLVCTDVASPLESNKMLPAGFMHTPEGQIWNYKECQRTGFVFNFDEIYENPNSNGKFVDLNQFCCAEYSSTEPLLSQFALWSLCRKNVFNREDVVPAEYYCKVLIRDCRPHHGVFDSGLVNIETKQ